MYCVRKDSLDLMSLTSLTVVVRNNMKHFSDHKRNSNFRDIRLQEKLTGNDPLMESGSFLSTSALISETFSVTTTKHLRLWRSDSRCCVSVDASDLSQHASLCLTHTQASHCSQDPPLCGGEVPQASFSFNCSCRVQTDGTLCTQSMYKLVEHSKR